MRQSPNTPEKEFGVSNRDRMGHFAWSCREQDLFNGEERLIFTHSDEDAVVTWTKTINLALNQRCPPQDMRI